MPVVVAQPVKRLGVNYNFGAYIVEDFFLLPIDKIIKRYEHRFKRGTTIRCYVSRIFNEKFKLVSRPRIFCTLNLVYAESRGGRRLCGWRFFGSRQFS